MAISPEILFPPGKRRPGAGAFVSPKLISGGTIVESLVALAGEISALKPLRFPLRKTSASMIRNARLLSVVFEGVPASAAALCLEEIHIALQRLRGLVEGYSAGSRMWALMDCRAVSGDFREVASELATLLDIFPASGLGDDVAELVALARKRFRGAGAGAGVDLGAEELRREVAGMMEGMERGVVPDPARLREALERVGVSGSSGCRDEVERLRDEGSEPGLIGLVRYAKCVLFGLSTSPGDGSGDKILRRRASEASAAVPADFRCPITLEVMRDPVVAATGQTYDREAIRQWIESGHRTCPKSGQALAHTDLIPNRALRSLIGAWCRDQGIAGFEADVAAGEGRAAIGATRMTAEYLVGRLAAGEEGAVAEIRSMAKADSQSRACVAEAGAVPYLVPLMGSVDPGVQVNAVTAVLNLSILEANKGVIMETEGAAAGLAEVLGSRAATWEARGNAAAAVFSLSSAGPHRRRLGRKGRVARGLAEVAREGPPGARRDALAAALSLAADREGCLRLVEAGAVEAAAAALAEEEEAAAAVIEAAVRKGGLLAVAAAFGAVKRLGAVLRGGTERARESAAAALVAVCHKGGGEAVGELAAVEGIERVVWEVMGTGTPRGRRKAASLMNILRRWAAASDGDYHRHNHLHYGHSAAVSASAASLLPST